MGTSSNALKLRGPIRLYHCYSLKGFLALKSKIFFFFFSREKRVRVRVKIWELLQTRSNSEDQFVCIIAIVWRAFWLWNPKFFLIFFSLGLGLKYGNFFKRAKFFFLGKNELGLGLKYGNFFKRAQTPRTNSSVSLL